MLQVRRLESKTWLFSIRSYVLMLSVQQLAVIPITRRRRDQSRENNVKQSSSEINNKVHPHTQCKSYKHHNKQLCYITRV